MFSKIVDRETTLERIERAWKESIQEGVRLGVSAFAKRAAISSSTLYHVYPEWAQKVIKRRDENKDKSQKRKVIRKQQKSKEVELLKLVDSLRKEVLSLQKELGSVTKERDKLQKRVEYLQDVDSHNERLRALVPAMYQILLRYLETRSKAEKIMYEVKEFCESNIGKDEGEWLGTEVGEEEATKDRDNQQKPKRARSNVYSFIKTDNI